MAEYEQLEMDLATQPRLLKRSNGFKEPISKLLQLEAFELCPTGFPAKVEADATRFEAFPERLPLWKCVRTSSALPGFVRKSMEGYVCACKSKHRGRERYEFSARYGVAGDGERLEDQTWRALAGGSGEDPIDRSAIVASIALRSRYRFVLGRRTLRHVGLSK